MDSYSYRCVWENLREFIGATCLQSLARPEECIRPSGKSSRWLWATTWVLGIQYRSSAKATSVHNHVPPIQPNTSHLRATQKTWELADLLSHHVNSGERYHYLEVTRHLGHLHWDHICYYCRSRKKEKQREKGSTKQNPGRCFPHEGCFSVNTITIYVSVLLFQDKPPHKLIVSHTQTHLYSPGREPEVDQCRDSLRTNGLYWGYVQEYG